MKPDFFLFCVFDAKLASFNVPFVQKTEAGAVRAFSDLVQDKRSAVSMHPEDYTLFCVGSFDSSTGVLTPCQPRALTTASALLVIDPSDKESAAANKPLVC